MQITHHPYESKGKFVIEVDGKHGGEVTYSRAGKGKIIIDHTEVEEEFSGQGFGKKMVMAAVDYARENDLKIIPLCPFAKSVFDKEESIQDVLR